MPGAMSTGRATLRPARIKWARSGPGCVFRISAKEAIVGNFTPVSGLIGGLLIGLAAALLLLLNVRISGISGIVGGLLAPSSSDACWRVVLVAWLLLGAFT